MNTQLLTKVAAVLDAMADEFDARTKKEAEKLAAHKAEIISPMAEKLSLAAGVDVEAVRAKLSGVDSDVLTIISKFAAEEAPAELGGPNRNKTASAANAKDQADQRFLAWLST